MNAEGRIEELLDGLCVSDAGEGLRHCCSRRAVPAESEKLDVPSDVSQLWAQFDEVRLFEDKDYGQWGVVLWGLEKCRARQDVERSLLVDRDAFVEGDLVVGEFLGDTDKLLVRCNPLTDDYGSVLVALPIDRRKQWPVWLSLAQFVEDFAEHDGEKCWPH